MLKKNGFTFIEVLMALAVLMITFLGIGGLNLVALQSSREVLMQTIAIQQLESMAAVMQIPNIDIRDFYNDWNSNNRQMLPDGFGEIARIENHRVLRIRWRSAFMHEWKCRSHKMSRYACLEVEVLI